MLPRGQVQEGPSGRDVQVSKQIVSHLNRVGTNDYSQRMQDRLDLKSEEDRARAPLHYWLSRILNSPGFDYFMGLVIIINMCVMIVETDRSTLEEEESVSSASHWTTTFGWMVLSLFVVELLVRLFVLQCFFWKDPWNIFDFAIVVTDVVFSLLGLIVGDLFPVSMLRIFRLAKLARVSKVLRVFPELRLLLAGLLSSLSAIFWGTLLLFFCLLVWSMAAVLFIHPLNKRLDYGDCERCPRAYSSVMQATLTFWQQIVTGDSWGQSTIPLIETHPSTALFFVPVFLSIGMAVMNLILGVVVSVAEQAKDEIKLEDNAEKTLMKLERETHLFELCTQMDADNSGMLTREEIYNCLDSPGDFQDNLMALQITKEDFDIAWSIMDTDRSGTVSYKEFVSTLCKMRSSDTQFMLAYIKCYITEIRSTLLQVMEHQHDEAMAVERQMEAEIVKIERVEEDILNDGEKILSEFQREGSSERTSSVVVHDGGDASQKGQMDDEFSKPSKEDKFREPAGLQIQQGGDNKNPVASKPRIPAPDAGRAVTSSSVNDDTQVWLKNVCDDIGTLRIELKDILMDISYKLGPPVLPLASMRQEGMNSAAQPALVAVADKQSTCSLVPMFCTNPLTSGKRGPGPVPENMSAQDLRDDAGLISSPKGALSTSSANPR